VSIHTPGPASSLRVPFVFILVTSAIVVTCGPPAKNPGAQLPGSGTDSKPKKVEKEFYTDADRLAVFRDATIFVPRPVADADIVTGPPQAANQFQFHFNDKIICDFHKAGEDMGGKTPKFECTITRVESADGTVQTLTPTMDEGAIKVKYGGDDNEIYAEVASTRLLWALGFLVDAWYPVHVECHKCPADPESGSGAIDTRTFAAATVVRKFDGDKMYVVPNSDQGWSWKELDENSGRPTYERDSLKLMAAFIQHSDNKPPQQRLVCHGVDVNQSKTPFKTTCKEAYLVVQDVGATLGGGGLFTSNDSAKMNVEEWSGVKLWKTAGTPAMKEADCPVCEAHLRNSLTASDGLNDPTISEEGRRLAAGLLCQLSDSQIENVFRESRVVEMPKYRESDGSFRPGLNEATILSQWVAAFKEKREDLAGARCKWNKKPSNLAAIDNPARLAAVPNHCTSHPF
jgi:hypothetical protein